MPDQTPATDDDRKAHQFSDNVLANPGDFGPDSVATARAVKAHVPVPPATLANALRNLPKAYATSSYLDEQLNALADRADELEERTRQAESYAGKYHESIQQRDEARAEGKTYTSNGDSSAPRNQQTPTGRPPMTDITDQDRRLARQWADEISGYPTLNENARAAVNYILATVDAPAPTVSEELATIAGGWTGWTSLAIDEALAAVTARAEQMEHDLTEARAEVKKLIRGREKLRAELDETCNEMANMVPASAHHQIRAERDEFMNDMISSERKQAKLEAKVERKISDWRNQQNLLAEYERLIVEARAERDEARAEVERLTATFKETLKEPGHLSDPADVPSEEMWLMRTKDGQAMAGVRNSGGNWSVLAHNGFAREDDLGDEEVTLVARLVPDTRRVIDRVEALDALPVGSIVIDGDDDPWKKTRSGEWILGEDYQTSDELLRYIDTSVRVIHEPEETP